MFAVLVALGFIGLVLITSSDVNLTKYVKIVDTHLDTSGCSTIETNDTTQGKRNILYFFLFYIVTICKMV